jgi:hypothetical protein
MSNQPNPNVFFRSEDMGIGNFPIKGGTMNQPINNGGYAFPMTSGPEPRVDCSTHYNEGMTLRDYFAAKAINEVGWYNNINQSAIMAYEIADALLKARGEAK